MNKITTIYYTEVNLICIIILLLFKNQLNHNSAKYSNANNIFNLLLSTTIILCFSDMIAGIFRGQLFYGAKSILQISNLLFDETLSIISYLWLIYVYIKVDNSKNLRKKLSLYSIPLIIFTIIALTNPFTSLIFTINEQNLYVRNTFTIYHWIITWLYLIIPTIKVALAIIRQKNKNKQKELIPFLYFIIAPFIAGFIQMFHYGITSSQVGITISIVIIALFEQSNLVFSDSLTGLNNRHSFNNFIDTSLQHHYNESLTLIMIDINDFKQINDKYGHNTGDKALIDIANVLKTLASQIHNNLFLCRYGGDEFLIASFNCSPQNITNIQNNIFTQLATINKQTINPYTLKISLGISTSIISNYKSIEKLIAKADQEMYISKKISKALF